MSDTPDLADSELYYDLLARCIAAREANLEWPADLGPQPSAVVARLLQALEFWERGRRRPSTASLAPGSPSFVWVPAPADGPADGGGPGDARPGSDRIGRFTLKRLLGRGGFGVVYLATDPRLKRDVALKLPRSRALDDPALRRRFLREAEASAGLDHPNLITVHEAGEDGPHCYIASAFVDGTTLGEWSRARLQAGRPVAPAEAAGLVAAVADGVHHANDRGVLHCDLKPANVLLEGSLTPGATLVPKVTDFGLARVVGSTEGLSLSGQIIGTPQYMAPEQASGRRKDVTPRTDVFALGVILFELLTGRLPFPGDDTWQVLTAVREADPPRPRSLRRDVPADLEAVCLKCLEKDPAHRYASAGELADDLRAVLAGDGTRARPLGPAARAARWVRQRPAWAGVLLLLGLSLPALAVGLPSLLLARADAERERFFRGLEGCRARRTEGQPGWTWDNREALLSLTKAPPAADYVSDLRNELLAALTAPDLRKAGEVGQGFRPFAIAYSPDGRTLAVGAHCTMSDFEARVRLVTPAGEPVRELVAPIELEWKLGVGRPENVSALAFSPDGRWLVAGTRSRKVHRWDLQDRTTDRPITEQVGPRSFKDEETVRLVAFHPTRPRLYTGAPDGEVVNWDTTTWRRVAKADSPGPVTLAGDAGLVAVRGGALVSLGEEDLQPWRPPLGRVPWSLLPADRAGPAVVVARREGIGLLDTRCGTANPLVEALDHAKRPPGRRAAFSPAGWLLVSAEVEVGRVKLWDLTGGVAAADLVTEPRAGLQGTLWLTFDPAGKKLAVGGTDSTLLHDVAVSDILTPHVMDPLPAFRAAASADGGQCAWVAESRPNPDGPPDASVVRVSVGPGADGSGPAAEVIFSPQLPLAAGGSVNALAVHPAGGPIALALTHTAVGWDPTTRHSWKVQFEDDVDGLAIGHDGRVWVMTGHDLRALHVPDGRVDAAWGNGRERRLAGATLYRVVVGRTHVLLGRRDGMLILLDQRAREVGAWEVTRAPARAVALSPNESLAAVASQGGELRVVRLPSGETVFSQERAHTQAIDAVAFLGNDLVATGGRDHAVRLWDARGQELFRLKLPLPVEWLGRGPDGASLLIHEAGGRGVRRLRLDRLFEQFRAHGLGGGLPALPFGPPAAAPAAAPSPGGVELEVLGAGGGHSLGRRQVAALDGHWRRVAPTDDALPETYTVRYKGVLRPPAPGTWFFRLRASGRTKVWVDEQPVVDPNVTDPANDTFDVLFGAPARALTIEMSNTKPLVHDDWCQLFWRQGEQPFTLVPAEAWLSGREGAARDQRPATPAVKGLAAGARHPLPGRPRRLAVAPDGGRAAVRLADHRVVVVDLKASKTTVCADQQALVPWEEDLPDVAFTPDGLRVVSPGPNRSVRVWRADTGAAQPGLERLAGDMGPLALSPDGARVLLARALVPVPPEVRPEGKLFEVGLQAGADKPTLTDLREWAVTSLAWPGGGRQFWCADGDAELSALGPDPIRRWRFKPAGVASLGRVVATPDGRRVATACERTGRVVVVDRPGNKVVSWAGHGGDFRSLALSPDGRRVAVVGADRWLHVWDVDTGRVVAQARGFDFREVAFLGGGGRLVAACEDREGFLLEFRVPE